jgi:hypothetical protein
MAITPVVNAVTRMSWLPRQASPQRPSTGWTPTPLPSAPASTATPGAGDALAQGARDAAKQAFLFGLKIAFSDQDRATSARAFLAYTQNLTYNTIQSDPALASLQALAQSVVSRTQNHSSTYLSGISTVA